MSRAPIRLAISWELSVLPLSATTISAAIPCSEITFCAFEGPPKIVRLHGRGEALEPGDDGFAALVGLFPARPGTRTIVRVRLDRIADSCGYAVPLYHYEGERAQLDEWATRKGPQGVVRYRADNNAESIDGLPGLRRR